MKKLSITGTLILILFFSIQKTTAQLAEVASGMSTGMAINQVMDGLNGVIDKAVESGDFLLARAAQELLYTIQGFEGASINILDKAFDEISEERKEVINKTIEIANQLDTTIDIGLSRAEGMVDQVNRMVRETTFKNYPVIFRYRGAVVVPGENNNIRLIITGHELTNEDPYLIFKDKTYPAKKSGNDLLFEIPRKIFKHKSYDFRADRAVLTVYDSEGMWWWKSVKEVSYDIHFLVLPKNLGKVQVEYKVLTEELREAVTQREVSHDHSGLQSNSRNFSINVSNPDRKIDTERSWIAARSGNRGGELVSNSVRVTSAGMSFTIKCKRATVTTPGFRHVEYKKVEVWTEKAEKDTLQKLDLKWNEDILVDITSQGTRAISTVELFTGKISRLVTSGRPSKYVEVSMNENGILIFKPTIPRDLKSL